MLTNGCGMLQLGQGQAGYDGRKKGTVNQWAGKYKSKEFNLMAKPNQTNQSGGDKCCIGQ